jgi:anti-sigma factor RsiW
MDPSKSIPDAIEPANACRESASLSAYYDGELAPADAARVKQHVASCQACQAELDEIGELSALAKDVGALGLSDGRRRKIHRLVDAERTYSVLRIAGVLTGLAASAAVIGGVWLSEIPASRSQPQPYVVVPDPDKSWPQVAIGDFRTYPLPTSNLEVRDQPMFADARLANWMFHGLSGRPR